MVESRILRRFVRNPEVALREEDEDGAILFNPDTCRVKVLNSTGLAIWKLCDGAHGIPEITRSLIEAFEGANVEDVAKDVEGFLDFLGESGFLTKDTGSASP